MEYNNNCICMLDLCLRKIKEYNNFELKILYSLYIINAIEKIFPYQGLAHGIIYALHFVLSPWLALCELCVIYIFGIMGLFFWNF